MRWFWIDRFVEFVSGQHATAIKNVSLGEEQVQDYFPNHPLMPSSLIVEGLAQTGGLLVSQTRDFLERIVLAKIGKAQIHQEAEPGETLIYRAEIQSLQNDGAIIYGTSHVGDRLQAEVEMAFAYLDQRFEGVELFEPESFLRLLKMLRLFDVGVSPDGTPIQIPEYLLKAESAKLNALEA